MLLKNVLDAWLHVLLCLTNWSKDLSLAAMQVESCSLHYLTIEAVKNFQQLTNQLLAMTFLLRDQGRDCSCEADGDADEAHCIKMPPLRGTQTIA